MDLDAIRQHCLALPHATEIVQWGTDLCFKIGGKLFAVAPLEVAPVRLSFKCTAENFAELCERPSIIPAPYLARAHWVALESLDAVPDDELRDLIAESYRLVWERLPKKLREELTAPAGTASPRRPGTAPSGKSAPNSAKKASRAATERRK